MESNCIIPIHEIVKILKPKPAIFVSIVPFFQFSIGLRMLDASFNVFNIILLKKLFKSAIGMAILVSLVGIELCPSIMLVCQSRCTMDRLCLRSNRIQGFLRFDLLRFKLANP